MAPQTKGSVAEPPKTLPSDFFDKQGTADTLPGNFDFGDKPPQEESTLQSLTKTVPHMMPHSMSDVGHEIMTGLGNIGAGGMELLTHPQEALIPAMGPLGTAIDLLRNPDPTARGREGVAMAKEAFHHPLETVERGIGQAGAAGLAEPFAKIPGNLVERYSGYKSPVIDPMFQNASKAARAIRPPSGIDTHFESELQTELPRIKMAGRETGNPLHSQQEVGAASRGLAEKGLGHFNEQIIGPYEDELISMRGVPEYQGETSGEGKMTTLGQINARLTDINKLMRPSYGQKTTGAEMTAQEKLGLNKEASKLGNILYRELSKRTGIPEEDIGNLRQSYGRQFSIADDIDAARRARLGEGKANPSFPMSRSQALGQAVGKIFGQPEYFADRALRKALEPFPEEGMQYPNPAPPKPVPSARTPKGSPENQLNSFDLSEKLFPSSKGRK